MRWYAPLVIGAVLAGVGTAQAQQLSPVLTLDQDRLYVASAFGQRVQRDLAEASTVLSNENRRIETALVEEEQRLTDQRADMEPEEFRKLAEEFDARVTGIRQAQERKASDIQRRADRERARFFELAFPVLFQLVEETGAFAIIDNSAVIFSVRNIDITDEAIARVNAEIGEAPLPDDPGPTPQPRPEGAETEEQSQPDE